MAKRLLQDTAPSAGADFSSLPDDICLLVLTACGADIFAWNCVSRAQREFIVRHAVFRRISEFRFFFDTRYHDVGKRYAVNNKPFFANAKNYCLSDTRLLAISPTVLKLGYKATAVQCETLRALTSLTALSLEYANFEKAGFELEGAIDALTSLRHLEIGDVLFRDMPLLWRNVGKLRGLERLHLSGDWEDVPTNRLLRKLTNLRTLNMFMPDRPRVADISHLTRLEVVMLDGRDVTRELPASLPALKTLYVDCERDLDDRPVVPDLSFLPPNLLVITDEYMQSEMSWRHATTPDYYWASRSASACSLSFSSEAEEEEEEEEEESEDELVVVLNLNESDYDDLSVDFELDLSPHDVQ
jgi:hypothetical protein